MIKFFFADNNWSIKKASALIAVLTLLSRLVGLLRDRLFASHFGASDTLDIYYTAFRIPDTVFNLLILGTLSVAFIPVFSELIIKDKKHAFVVASTVLNLAVLVMGGLCGILFLLTPQMTILLAPGFDHEKLHSTIMLTRLLLLSPIIFTVSSIFSSVLISMKHFLVVNVAPIFYNLGIIFGLLFLYPHWGLYGLGVGVILGAVLHMCIQIFPAIYKGFRWQPLVLLYDSSVRKIMKLFIPRIFGLDTSYISLIIASVVGSSLASGSIAVFNLANNLQAVPLGMFAIGVATATFPTLASSFVKKDHAHFISTLRASIIQILFFIIPISVLMIVLRAHIVRLVLGTGKFGWEATIMTFNTMAVLAVSLFSQGLIALLARAFYARHNTKIPVVVSLIALVINIIISALCASRFGILGVAIGFSASSVVNCLVLFIILRRVLRKSVGTARHNLVYDFDKHLVKDCVKIIVASASMAAISYGALYAVAPFLNTHTVLGILLQTTVSVTFGVLGYLFITWQLKLDDSRDLIGYLKLLLQKYHKT